MARDAQAARCTKPAEFWLACPHSDCHTMKCAAKNTLWSSTRTCALKCKRCGKSTSAKRWLCPCGEPWYDCLQHRQAGFLCGTKASAVSHGVPPKASAVRSVARSSQAQGNRSGASKRRVTTADRHIPGYMEFNSPGPDVELLNTVRSTAVARRILEGGQHEDAKRVRRTLAVG